MGVYYEYGTGLGRSASEIRFFSEFFEFLMENDNNSTRGESGVLGWVGGGGGLGGFGAPEGVNNRPNFFRKIGKFSFNLKWSIYIYIYIYIYI